MKQNKKIIIISAIVLVVLFIIIVIFMKAKKPVRITAEISSKRGTIKEVVTTTGSVIPQNRLEIKPPIAGRVEKILVVEGQMVKVGQEMGFMSSSDRAAIMDAARAEGEKSLKEWEDTYKLIPLVAPINGEVIVATVQPGQTLQTTDDFVVLSDRLIVRAQVDETDIGKVQLGQKTNITLDAYSNTIVPGTVNHIYYESQTVNNVTIYNVDVLPDKVPDFFRSGMSANLDIIQKEDDNVLLIPLDAVKRYNGKSFVFVKSNNSEKPERREVVTGLFDDDNIEIVSGISDNDIVLESKQNYVPQSGQQATNPFMMRRPSGGGGH